MAPKPFCNPTGQEYVRLEGRVHFDLRVYGDESGRFLRKYDIKGQLQVTPWNPLAERAGRDSPSPARIREHHAAALTDSYGQVYERASQELLGQDKQSLSWVLGAGEFDRYLLKEQCGQWRHGLTEAAGAPARCWARGPGQSPTAVRPLRPSSRGSSVSARSCVRCRW